MSAIDAIVDYAHLQQEVGAPGVAEVLERVDRCLADALAALAPDLATREPDDYEAIRPAPRGACGKR